MPVKPDREYRSAPMFIEEREGTERSYKVKGYASTFDRYELYRDGDVIFYEQFERDAFKECDMSDVIFNFDHCGRVYARTRNNSVKLTTDDRGLYCEIDLSRSTAARQALEDIECGNYDRMSFAFQVAEDAILHDEEAKTYTRVIKRVKKTFDISAVSFPANPNTEIGISARSRFDGEIAAEAQELQRLKALELRKRKIKILFELEN